ncbi:MOLPALP family lipoprotein [Mycoplasma mycoides]|uniref:MOLPALP family lipoprotein n=1 Tax=Mycoplasma mycoides TaxID=2102 RepID=UPI0001793F5E|nr:MOLPALP family lipoprotein [Mycoplasma mycoides]ADH21660.1 putative liporotein [synthetic Mycoplasma mycoides JCVI-syn1.0]ACU79022.1 putative liporotein [Mycoplasma mycoides subsp. capri str. GM12]ACU79854.1 putative liporotein [Mycoplasma mycoides subsp. capri str. GM12]SRX61511.1 MOLPALP family lipoprotein [Mycoplasma mycoides subsp. capri]SRX63125.1 MOLPALP family lipoprotein [Mycoplasma mycoides subsp. capri]
MKKILIGLSTFSLLVSSSSIVSCTITYQFKNNYLDQLKMILNTSSIAAQSIILSDKNTTNISTDYSLKTFSQTKINDLYKNEEKKLADKYVIDKKATYEYQFKSMFLSLENQKWTETLKKITTIDKNNQTTNLDLAWNDQNTKTTDNNIFKTLSLASAGFNFLFSGDFTPNQQGDLINNFLSNQFGLLESTVFKDNQFSNLIDQLNNIDNNQFYNLTNSLLTQPEWLNSDKENNLTKKTLKEILESSSKKLWDQILPKDGKQDFKIDWSKVFKPLIDLLKAFSIYYEQVEQRSDKNLTYQTIDPLHLFIKEKTNSEFLYEVLNTDLQTIYKNKSEDQIKQEINSINLKKIISFLKNTLVFDKEDKHGYKFQKFVVILLGSASQKESQNDITNNFLLKPFYTWYEKNEELVKKIITSKLEKIESIKPYASFVSNITPILFKVIKAFHQDLTEQGLNKKLSSELSSYLSLAKTLLPTLSVDKKVIDFLDSKSLKDFLNNPFLALYKQNFLKEVFQLINQLSNKEVINNQIIDNVSNVYNLTTLKLDKLLNYLLELIKKPSPSKTSLDEFQFLYGLKDLSISQIINNLSTFYNKENLDYIFNLSNFKNLLEAIFNKNITMSFKYKNQEKELKTQNNLSTILAILGLNSNYTKDLKIEIKDDKNNISQKIKQLIEQKQYGLISVILLGFDADKKQFYKDSILDNIANLFGHNDKDINKEASKNAINILIKSYLELINWFQNVSLKKYAKDNFSTYLDQNNWSTELIDKKGNIENLSKPLIIDYMLKYKNPKDDNQNWKFKVSITRTSDFEQPWKISEITKLTNN